MSSNYRIKVYAMRGVRTYWVVDDIFFRTSVGGANINTISAGTATAFSVYQTYVASYALPSQASVYHSNSFNQATMDAGNVWWRYDFNADYIFIEEYTMRARNDSYWTTDTAKTWDLEWYDFEVGAWVVIDSRVDVSWTAQNEFKTFTINYAYYEGYSGVGNLTASTNYIFKTTASGVHIYDMACSGIGFIVGNSPWLGYFYNAVWANDAFLYIGTNTSGVVRTPISSIASGVFNDIVLYKSYPDITSNNVLDISGNGDYLCVATASGVDEFHISTAARYFTTVSGAQRCFQTASGIYYTTSGNLHAVYDLNSNWTTPSYTYNSTKHESFIEVNTINDLVVVSGVICVGTNAGVVTIFESRGNERTSPYKIYKIK